MPLIAYLVFHRVWTCPIDISPKNLTEMLFGIKFMGIINMIQVIPKALLLEIPLFEWPRDCLLVVCLLGKIVWIWLACLNYISCIARSKVIDLTPIHSWSISYIVWPLVPHRGLYWGPHYPRCVVIELNLDDRVPSASSWTWLLLSKGSFVRWRLGVFVGFILGTVSCLSIILIELLYWTRPIFTFYRVMKSRHNPHHLLPLFT